MGTPAPGSVLGEAHRLEPEFSVDLLRSGYRNLNESYVEKICEGLRNLGLYRQSI